MLLFVLALVITALGVAAYGHYNPSAQDITFPNYHLSAVPDWVPLAIAAAVPLILFLLHLLLAPSRTRS